MKSIFYLAAGLLGISGVLHWVKLFVDPVEPYGVLAGILTGFFGLAYLYIAYRLARRSDSAVVLGIILPVLGLLITLIGMSAGLNAFTVPFIVLDVVVIALCAVLYVAGHAPIGRVS